MRVRRRKHIALHRGPAPAPTGSAERWSMDFVHDALADGRPFRVLTVVDQWSRQSPILEGASSMPGRSRIGRMRAACSSTSSGRENPWKTPHRGLQRAAPRRVPERAPNSPRSRTPLPRSKRGASTTISAGHADERPRPDVAAARQRWEDTFAGQLGESGWLEEGEIAYFSEGLARLLVKREYAAPVVIHSPVHHRRHGLTRRRISYSSNDTKDTAATFPWSSNETFTVPDNSTSSRSLISPGCGPSSVS